jgi:hypothetical protein
LLRFTVDISHLLNLTTSLLIIGLIDADSVHPKNSSLIFKLQMAQGYVQIPGDKEFVAVDDQRKLFGVIAPYI